MADSFATRARLDVNGKSYVYSSLPKLGERFDLAKLPYSMKILLENLLRHEDGVTVTPAHIEAVANLGCQGRTRHRNRLHASTRGAAGFHRRALRGRPCRDARRGRQARRQGQSDQSADPIGTGHRPLGAGRRVRPCRCARPQRQDRVRTQHGALQLPALGPEGVRQLQGRAAEHRHRASGEPREPCACRHGARESTANCRRSRTPCSAPTATPR